MAWDIGADQYSSEAPLAVGEHRSTTVTMIFLALLMAIFARLFRA